MSWFIGVQGTKEAVLKKLDEFKAHDGGNTAQFESVRPLLRAEVEAVAAEPAYDGKPGPVFVKLEASGHAGGGSYRSLRLSIERLQIET